MAKNGQASGGKMTAAAPVNPNMSSPGLKTGKVPGGSFKGAGSMVKGSGLKGWNTHGRKAGKGNGRY